MRSAHTGKKHPVWGGILIGVGVFIMIISLVTEQALGITGFVSVCVGISMFRSTWGNSGGSTGQPPVPGHYPQNFAVYPGHPVQPATAYPQQYPPPQGPYQQQYPPAPGGYPPNPGQYGGSPQPPPPPGAYGPPPQHQERGPYY